MGKLTLGLALAVYRKVTEMLVNNTISSQEDLDSFVLGEKFDISPPTRDK